MKISTFHYSEPNNSNADQDDAENCVHTDINSGNWNDRYCERYLPSICEIGHEVIW